MTNRASARWIRTCANAHKLSSFQDKLTALQAEPNPYYALEWLIAPDVDGDEAFWSAWDGDRTPGAERGSLISVRACFGEQLPAALLLVGPIGETEAALLATALYDLEPLYGESRWASGIAALAGRLDRTADRYNEYVEALRREEEALDRELQEKYKELEAEAAEYEEGSFDLEAERRAEQAKLGRKRAALPGKALAAIAPDDALLRTLTAATSAPRPAERARAAAERLRAAAAHPAAAWAGALAQGALPPAGEAGAAWLSAYMSRSEMTRGWLPEEERQRAALRAMTNDGGAGRWLAAAFRASGWEERLAEPEFAAQGRLHPFVWYALADEDRRRRLREELVLRHWETFSETMAGWSGDGRFENVSWALLLDPENVQQRLLRAGGGTAEAWIRSLCALYAEGIRRGLDPRIVTSLYAYLAMHDKEAFYSFVHGGKTLEEAAPMLELPPAALSELFRGDGVRQTGARKHLLQLFYEAMEGKAGAKAAQLQRLADILAADKRSAVVGWLQRHERDWRDWLSGGAAAGAGAAKERAITRLLRFRWLGTSEDANEQHRAVKEWLERHSDWVQFETDAPDVGGDGVRYTIAKPGAIDADSGEVLVRATVRAEWRDRGRVDRLLDDLKLL